MKLTLRQHTVIMDALATKARSLRAIAMAQKGHEAAEANRKAEEVEAVQQAFFGTTTVSNA